MCFLVPDIETMNHFEKKIKKDLIEGSSHNHLSTFPTTRYCNTILLFFTTTILSHKTSKLVQRDKKASVNI